MPKAKRGRGRAENETRQLRVAAVELYVRAGMERPLHPTKPRSREEEYQTTACVTVKGELSVPVGTRTNAELNVYKTVAPPSTRDIKAVGGLRGSAEKVWLFAFLHEAEFEALWFLAATGNLKCCSLDITKPFRAQADVRGVAFYSYDPEED